MKYNSALCYAIALLAVCLVSTGIVNAEQIMTRTSGLRRHLNLDQEGEMQKSAREPERHLEKGKTKASLPPKAAKTAKHSPKTSKVVTTAATVMPSAATVAPTGSKSMKGGPKSKSNSETTKAPKATKVPKGSASENTAKSAKLGKSKSTKTAPSVTTTTFAVVVEGCSCTEEVQNAIVEATEDSLNDPDAVVNIVSCTSRCTSSGRALQDSSTGGTIEVVFTVTTTTSNPEDAIIDNLATELGESGVNAVEVTVVDSSPTGTASPIASPTASATDGPTDSPIVRGTDGPTANPTANPTASPSNGPTAEPTANPSEGPTSVPSTIPSDGPTASPSVEPSTMPTASPSDGPTAAPVPSPSAMPSDSPSDGPTAAPVPSPSATPTDSPSDETSASPTASPSNAPSAAPVTTGPTVAPFAAPSTAPVGASCSNTVFTPIKDNGGTEVDFYYPYYDDNYGYTDDGNGGGGTLDQIDGIDDFTILDNGLMVFGNPWGCERGTDAGCRNTTLQIFEVFGQENQVNPLKADTKVFAKEENDGSVLVSWEGVQGKNGDGDVNVQAQLFSSGDARVCFGCGSLPSDVTIGVKIDMDGFRNDENPLPTLDFGPTDNQSWPENECFHYTALTL